MCLAIPGKLIEIANDPNGVRMGKANFGGIVKQVCLEYTPEVQTGDYVLVHVGFALSKVNEEEAARTYKLLEEMKQLGELDAPEVDPWSTARRQLLMKFLDEYRDEALATKIVDETSSHSHQAMGVDGSLRRTNAHHRQVWDRPFVAGR